MKFSPNPIAGFVPCPKCHNAALVHFPKGGTRQNAPYLHCMEHGSIQNQTKGYFEEKAVTTLDLFREIHGESDSVVLLDEAIKTKGLLMDISQLSRLQPEMLPPKGETHTAPFEPIEEPPKKDKNMQVTVTEEGEVLPPETPQPSEETKSESSVAWVCVGLLVAVGVGYGGYRAYQHWRTQEGRA